jgi:hypothetical protein
VRFVASTPKVACFPRIAERVYRTGSLCLVLDKLDSVAGVEKSPTNVKTANAVSSFAIFIRLSSFALSRHPHTT